MPWDRNVFLGYVETIQLILGVTDKVCYWVNLVILSLTYCYDTFNSHVNQLFVVTIEVLVVQREG